jgi:hypothetical protein
VLQLVGNTRPQGRDAGCWNLRQSAQMLLERRHLSSAASHALNRMADEADSTILYSLVLLKECDAAFQARHALLEVLEVAARSCFDSGLDLQGHCIKGIA